MVDTPKKSELEKELEGEGFVKTGMVEAWDFEKNKVMRGVFLSKEENVGDNNSNFYNFETSAREVVGVWGSTVLDTRLKNVQMGEEVVIVYLGRAKSQKRKGASYKNYEVYHRKPEEIAGEAGGAGGGPISE
jgi:hypothetical protein